MISVLLVCGIAPRTSECPEGECCSSEVGRLASEGRPAVPRCWSTPSFAAEPSGLVTTVPSSVRMGPRGGGAGLGSGTLADAWTELKLPPVLRDTTPIALSAEAAPRALPKGRSA